MIAYTPAIQPSKNNIKRSILTIEVIGSWKAIGLDATATPITGKCNQTKRGSYQVSQQVLDRNLAKKSLNVTKSEKTSESLFTV